MQIKPDKHFNIESSIINLTTVIIKELIKNKQVKYDKLFNIFKNSYEDATLIEFSYCLMLLYSLGKLEFFKENDVIGLINYEN
ncbi:hypothetical protein LGL55_20490 [Clostridium tagluense]|uniref:ABC-three component system middle component 6 n=1 Tax=Clostridium tagluense TaxID=360422 RepID=UPI001CF1DC6F|nr:ABC-three component system middle component 6 [Clostridium tagluense]MCB2313461.1 hypothetical protein [Clostridium tagluense]MCB2318272.1 hypothetical protein [Clostridium tagluense]MCB2323074.1 hypothetical protein [Clostridium tagluense]MCB2328056.1 hypothetical protein [Clostridium tagluense]MCB2332788.1 hypothetical protein [Clostridium tagluense]